MPVSLSMEDINLFPRLWLDRRERSPDQFRAEHFFEIDGDGGCGFVVNALLGEMGLPILDLGKIGPESDQVIGWDSAFEIDAGELATLIYRQNQHRKTQK